MLSADQFERDYGVVIENIIKNYLDGLGIVTARPVIVKAINGTDITVHFVGDEPTNTFVVQNLTGQTLTIDKSVTLIKLNQTATNSFIGFSK